MIMKTAVISPSSTVRKVIPFEKNCDSYTRNMDFFFSGRTVVRYVCKSRHKSLRVMCLMARLHTLFYVPGYITSSKGVTSGMIYRPSVYSTTAFLCHFS